MVHEKIITISTLLPKTAENKAAALQVLADKLDDDNLIFLAKICSEKLLINNTIRSNRKTLEAAIKAL